MCRSIPLIRCIPSAIGNYSPVDSVREALPFAPIPRWLTPVGVICGFSFGQGLGLHRSPHLNYQENVRPFISAELRLRITGIRKQALAEFGCSGGSELSVRCHPNLDLLPKANSGTFGTGHLDLAVVQQVPATRLVFGQMMRLDNLNPASSGSSALRIVFHVGGNVHELEHQIVRNFVGSERINRSD